jgi:hypothetical protein
MDFEADIREYILQVLPYEEANADALAELDVSQLLIIYVNWRERFVPQNARTVHVSEELRTSALISKGELSSAFKKICRKIAAGGDLTPRLSRKIATGFERPKSSKKNLGHRRDLDLMLNDWGIHHLHLSAEIEEDGFATRTGPLLFAAFQYQAAYLIQIYEHGAWTKKELIEIAIRNWPDAGIVHEVKGVLGLAQSYTETEHLSLRNVGINCPIEYAGKVYMSPRGLSTAGTSMTSVRHAGRLLDVADQFRDRLKNDPNWLVTILATKGLACPEKPKFKFVFDERGYGVLELESRAFFRLND